MDVYIKHIKDQNIPRRNGNIVLMCGTGGSGKSSLLRNWFSHTNYFKGVFDNVFYFTPEASFLSQVDSPFQGHNKVFHELTPQAITELHDKLTEIKEEWTSENKHKDELEMERDEKDYVGRKRKGGLQGREVHPMKKRKRKNQKPVYNCVIIDDFADQFKRKDIVDAFKKLYVKTRHLNTMIIKTTQGYLLENKDLRKMSNYVVLFKPNNASEFEVMAAELVDMDKSDALQLFRYCFDADFNYLSIDCRLRQFYKNNNRLLINNEGEPGPLEIEEED